MASIAVRNLDDELKEGLRRRAARQGRSMEEEARDILRCALAGADDGPQDLAASIRRRLRAPGEVELELPPREAMHEPPDPGR